MSKICCKSLTNFLEILKFLRIVVEYSKKLQQFLRKLQELFDESFAKMSKISISQEETFFCVFVLEKFIAIIRKEKN